jgi:hypothetical protein
VPLPGHLDAEERHGRRRGQHPERQACVHRAEAPVACRPERLEDRAVQNVRADRERRLEPEEEDEQRRQKSAAAHAGHADEEADQQSRD